MLTASGRFDVEMIPFEADDQATLPMRMKLTKRFFGDFVGEGSGQMMTAVSAVEGSAGYVAIERVSGTLNGVQGSFVLQHNALMHQGSPVAFDIAIVPDSGSDALASISGIMKITFADDGTHLYELVYEL